VAGYYPPIHKFTSEGTMIYGIHAEVLDDICIVKSQSASNQYETLDYIPGRIVWGALADLTGIKPGEEPSKEFIEVFYSGSVIFNNLYPSAVTDAYVRTYPTPLSARTMKSKKGFKNDGCLSSENGWGGGVCDWLIDGVPRDVDTEEWIIHPCFYSSNYKTIEPTFTYSIHHERDNKRGTTKEGQLFTRVSISRGNRFVGYLKILDGLPSNARGLIDGLIKRIKAYPDLYIGRKPGRIRLEISEYSDYYNEISMDQPSDRTITFTITCYSDTILTEDGGFFRYLSYIPAEIVEKELSNVIQSVNLENWFSSTIPVHGWHGVYRRPAEIEIGIQKGSAFLFNAQLKDGVSVNDVKKALQAIQLRGIGLRRTEGFGEIRINDPFHKEQAWRTGKFQ